MQVQRVAVPGSRAESWTVLGDDDIPVAPVEGWLAYLTAIDRSPNTVKAYAHDLKDFLVFLARRGLDWRGVRLEDLGVRRRSGFPWLEAVAARGMPMRRWRVAGWRGFRRRRHRADESAGLGGGE